MRGYATIVAGFVMAVVLLATVSSIVYVYFKSQERIGEAETFYKSVEERKNEINCALISHTWENNVFSFKIKNTGSAPVKNSEMAFLLDGKEKTFSISEEKPDGYFTPGETFEINIPITHRPHRLTVVLGPFSKSFSVHGWLDGCLYRRRITAQANTHAVINFLFDTSKEDGNTIRFTKSDGETEINYFIDYFVGGNARIWVYTDENEFYMYYGGCTTPERNTESVFIDVVGGLVAYYPLDGNGEDLAFDNDLNTYNVLFVSGKRGLAGQFAGNTTSYMAGTIGNMDENITALFWMETNDVNNNGTPLSYSSSTSPDEFVIYDYQNFRIYRETNYRITGISANDGIWHHIAVTWDTSGLVNLYKDGNFVYSSTNLRTGDPLENNGLLVLGQEQDLTGFDAYQSFKGLLDEVLIFGRVLGGDEIRNIYENDVYTSDFHPGKAFVIKYPWAVATVWEEEYK